MNEIKKRFINNSSIPKAITYLDPNNEDFLNFENLKPLATYYNTDISIH